MFFQYVFQYVFFFLISESILQMNLKLNIFKIKTFLEKIFNLFLPYL